MRAKKGRPIGAARKMIRDVMPADAALRRRPQAQNYLPSTKISAVRTLSGCPPPKGMAETA